MTRWLRHFRTAGFLPVHVQRGFIDLPRQAHTRVRYGQGSILRRVGRKLVQDECEHHDRPRPELYVRTLGRDLLEAVERLEGFCDDLRERDGRPTAAEQNVVGATERR